MKKMFLLFFIIILFSSCIFFEDTCPPGLESSISSSKVKVNEKIELNCFVIDAFSNNRLRLTVYIEDYPENTTIVSGTLYEPLTTEKYLCIEPVLINKRDGLVKVQMSFSEPGEYVIKCNGFYSGSSRITQLYTQDFHTFTITVTE